MEIKKQQNYGLIFLRIVIAVLILIHGVTRIYFGIVDDFGEFLTLNNLPFGFYTAWTITIFEIFGSILLASGYFVSPIAIVFSIQLIFGIILVHGKEGWFVVGSGRNGVEYSVLLISVFITLAILNFRNDESQ